MKIHWLRFINDFKDLSHSYVNLFVEFLRIVIPIKKKFPGYRQDDHKWVKTKKDLAYWLGHVLAWAFPVIVFIGAARLLCVFGVQ